MPCGSTLSTTTALRQRAQPKQHRKPNTSQPENLYLLCHLEQDRTETLGPAEDEVLARVAVEENEAEVEATDHGGGADAPVGAEIDLRVNANHP